MLYNKANWEINKETGDIGEATILPLLMLPIWCWRTDKGLCHRRQEIEYLAQRGKVDADVLLRFDNCGTEKYKESCTLVDASRANKAIRQYHEIKTNVATFDKAITSGANREQNIYIELIQKLSYYLTNSLEKDDDPFSEGGKLEYRGGIGWWDKREQAYKEGKTRLNHATWYHFYEPMDMWERVKEVEGFEDIKRPTGAEPQYQRATDEEIKEWLADKNITSEAILITQIPVEIVISVPGKLLEKLVEDIRYRYDIGYPDWAHVYELDGHLMSCKIPIKELIPCINMGHKCGEVKIEGVNSGTCAYEWAGKEPNEYYNELTYTQGEKMVLVSLVGEYVRKDGKGKRIKSIIPGMTRSNNNNIPLTSDAIYYVPARLVGDAVRDDEGNMDDEGNIIEGVTGVNVNAYMNPYKKDKESNIWVPRIIWEFDNMKLKKYPDENIV